MMTLNAQGNYEPWVQPQYGFDANDVMVIAPEGYTLLSLGDRIKRGDVPFDVYSDLSTHLLMFKV